MFCFFFQYFSKMKQLSRECKKFVNILSSKPARQVFVCNFFWVYFFSLICLIVFNLRKEYIHQPIKKNDPLLMSTHSLHISISNLVKYENGDEWRSLSVSTFFMSFFFHSVSRKLIENNIWKHNFQLSIKFQTGTLQPLKSHFRKHVYIIAVMSVVENEIRSS